MTTRSDALHIPAPRARPRGRPPRADADGRARRYDPAETRTRILEAAYLLFGTRGYPGTGTADIAALADVSEGSIFYHFGSKNGLLVELGRLHGQKMVAAMQADESLETLSLETSLHRCFDFCEVNNIWEDSSSGGQCAQPQALRKSSPGAEPFFHATREIIVDWTRAHLDALAARHGEPPADRTLTAQLVFVTVNEAMHQYFAPGATPQCRARIRAGCVAFCAAAVRNA